MTPEEYEHFVAKQYEREGYTTEVTPLSGDGGIDIFACKDGLKVGIQAKMYGNTSRSVNRATIHQLMGAGREYDCNKMVLVTDGNVLPDAKQAADKIGIEIRYIYPDPSNKVRHDDLSQTGISSETLDKLFQLNEELCKSENSEPIIDYTKIPSFGDIWENYIKGLVGKTIPLSNATDKNTIITVDNSGLKRITKNKKTKTIPIESFRWTYNRLIRDGYVSRKDINDNVKLCSSGIVAILRTIPFINIEGRAKGLRIIESLITQ